MTIAPPALVLHFSPDYQADQGTRVTVEKEYNEEDAAIVWWCL